MKTVVAKQFLLFKANTYCFLCYLYIQSPSGLKFNEFNSSIIRYINKHGLRSVQNKVGLKGVKMNRHEN